LVGTVGVLFDDLSCVYTNERIKDSLGCV